MPRKIAIMKKFVISFFGVLSLLFGTFRATAQENIYYYKIDEEIAKPALRKTQLALKEATGGNFSYILLEMNTFGGELSAADEIRTLLLEAPMPIIAFINNNAASAGALITIACDSIYMAPGASIGAASVVNQAGEIMPDKYQSYMRSLMRATAERNGRNPQIAEAMVDPDTYVEGVSEVGKVLTFTTNEAIENGFCEGEVSTREAALQAAGISDFNITEQNLSWIEKVINFLVSPVVSSILIMMMVGGIYFELQSPGLGLPIIIALIGALLFFAPHYLQGLADHWEILLFIGGLALLILEIFVIPGFGVAGISGIVLMVGALVLAMIFNIGFDFHFAPRGAVIGNFFNVLTALIIGFFISLWLSKKVFLMKTKYGVLALDTELKEADGFTSVDNQLSGLVGKEGTALTFMRPAGKVEVDGEIYDAVTDMGVVEQGTTVRVVKFENAQLVVEKANL